MRLARMRLLALVFVLSIVALPGCIAPALLLPTPGDLMLSVLKPLVGLDPKTAHLYELPIVKERMSALLGPHYDTAITLLETADKLEREGPLFYVISKYSPLPEIAEKAGLVWNADTNQMAVAIASGEGVQVFSEAVARKVEERAASVVDAGAAAATGAALEATAGSGAAEVARAVVPQWPQAMQDWVTPVTEAKRAEEGG